MEWCCWASGSCDVSSGDFRVEEFDEPAIDNEEFIEFGYELSDSEGTVNSFKMSPGSIQGQNVLDVPQTTNFLTSPEKKSQKKHHECRESFG